MTSDFKRAAKKVAKFNARSESAMADGLESGIDDFVSSMRKHLAKNGSIATGTLVQGLRSFDAPDVDPRGFTGQMVVGPEYWRYVEFGTGMGSRYKAADPMAPPTQIYEWIRAKGIIPNPTGPYDTQWQLARAIAEDAGRSTKASPFVRPAWRGANGKRHVVNETGRAWSRALDRSF
jgi:hypothetical protein